MEWLDRYADQPSVQDHQSIINYEIILPAIEKRWLLLTKYLVLIP